MGRKSASVQLVEDRMEGRMVLVEVVVEQSRDIFLYMVWSLAADLCLLTVDHVSDSLSV